MLNKDNFSLLTEIDWEIFRRSLKVTTDQSFVNEEDFNEKALKLLKTKRTAEFNNIRKRNSNLRINISNADLSDTTLLRADLSGADLLSANFSKADLSGADLSYAYLLSANLSGASLSNANLFNANLSNTIIINPKYDNLIVDEKTNFTNTIIDDPKFIDYIKQFNDNVPNKIENKRELKSKLEERKLDKFLISEVLSYSILSG